MGAKFGCLRKHSCMEQDFHQPESRIKLEPSLSSSGSNTKRNKAKTEQIMTLEDHLLASPWIYRSSRDIIEENQVSKQKANKVHPSACPERNKFFTPVSSFSKSKRLGKIEEVDEEVVLEASITNKTTLSGSSRKKVSFKLPEEADIFFYSPGEPFEE